MVDASVRNAYSVFDSRVCTMIIYYSKRKLISKIADTIYVVRWNCGHITIITYIHNYIYMYRARVWPREVDHGLNLVPYTPRTTDGHETAVA